MRHFLLALAFVLFSYNVHSMESKVYLGVGVGETDFDDGNWTQAETVPITSDTDGNSIKVFSGYRVNQYIALEGQYTQYADTVYSSPASKRKSEINIQSYSLSANAGYTFGFGLRPFIVAGVGLTSLKTDGFYRDLKENELSYRFGGGVEYTAPMLSDVTFRLAYERDNFELSSGDKTFSHSIASTYLGISYNF